jgi:replication-associated recombination protein RarA
MQHTLWTEKYRSQTLDQYIGNTELKTTIGSWITKNDIPHLLLYGKAGTGKTTLAKLITQNINCDMMDTIYVQIINSRRNHFRSIKSIITLKL